MNSKRTFVNLARLMAAALCVASVSASPAMRASFTVSPTQVFLTPLATSALLTLRNESGDSLRFQITAFTWDQTASGEMQLTPTDDVVFFPRLVELAAHEERKVKVGTTATFGTVERTYRIFVEELPALKGAEPVSGTGVQMRTRMGIPVFLRPAQATAGGALSDPATTKGTVTVRLDNRGTVHLVADSVQLRGQSANGAVVFTKTLNGWYILAGKSQAFDFALTPAECKATVTMVAEAKAGDSTLHSQATLDQAGCSAAR
jgi:fimbrial chaperone protein